MEAPDKIFVRDFGNSLCKVWTYNKGKKKGDVDVEYIRKDKLIEWAKQKQYESTTIVADNFWQEVIDKLNSL